MKFALIDDDIRITEELNTFIQEFASEQSFTAETECFKDGESFLEKFLLNTYDIIFIDIYMSALDGIRVTQKIREADSKVFVVFLTSSAEHMGQAFGCHAFDYLLKPLQKDKLFRCLADILKLIPNTQKYLTFSNGNIEIQLLYSNILYLRASNHNTLVMTADGTEYRPYIYYKKLAETLSGDERFLQVSRGILCNMDHITGFSKNSCFMTDDVSVPITIRNARQLEQAWRNYEFMQIHRLTDKKES